MGFGGIVNASRSLICAYKSEMWKDKFKEEEFKEATRSEAIRMRDEINSKIIRRYQNAKSYKSKTSKKGKTNRRHL